MDNYYQSQASLPYYSGGVRQRGSGIGALAITAGRFALPVLKNVLLPAAKRFGKALAINALPEVGELLAGNQTLKSAAKKTVHSSIKSQLGSGRKRRQSTQRLPAKKRRRPRSTTATRKSRSSSKTSRKRRRKSSSRKSPSATATIRRKKPTKRSRVDILGNLNDY